MKKRTHKAIKRSFREQMLEDGAYDGRFRPSVAQSKKRKASKQACRKYKYVG